MKFIKGHMESIDGIEIYPIISLLLFVLFFGVLFARVIFFKKEHLEQLKRIPLIEEENKTVSWEDLNPTSVLLLF